MVFQKIQTNNTIVIRSNAAGQKIIDLNFKIFLYNSKAFQAPNLVTPNNNNSVRRFYFLPPFTAFQFVTRKVKNIAVNGCVGSCSIKRKPKFEFPFNDCICQNNILRGGNLKQKNLHTLFKIPILRRCFKSPAKTMVTVE